MQVTDSFVEALARNDPSIILSGPDTSLATHRMVFAAEKALLTGRVVCMNIAD